jgi:hypothetical protein
MLRKLIVLAFVLSLLGCPASNSSTDYTIGTAIVSWNAPTGATYYVITQTPGDQGSATDSRGDADASPVPNPLLFYLTPGSYTFTVSAYALSTDPQNNIPPIATATALPSPVSVSVGQTYNLTATLP